LALFQDRAKRERGWAAPAACAPPAPALLLLPAAALLSTTLLLPVVLLTLPGRLPLLPLLILPLGGGALAPLDTLCLPRPLPLPLGALLKMLPRPVRPTLRNPEPLLPLLLLLLLPLPSMPLSPLVLG